MLRRKKRFAEAADAYTGAIARQARRRRADWPLFYERGVALSARSQVAEGGGGLPVRAAARAGPAERTELPGYSWTEHGPEPAARRAQMIERA